MSKKKIPRIALNLPPDPLGLCTRCSAIWSNVKVDTGHFPTPYPPPAEVEADLATLAAALQAAESGGPIAMTMLYAAASKVRLTFQRLCRYVESVVLAGPAEDAPALISSVLMYQSNVGKRAPKPALAAKDGVTSGDVVLVALALASVTAYFWEVSVDQLVWTLGGRSSQAHVRIPGLTPGKVYYFRFHGLLRDGTMTNDSQVVRFMVR